MAGERDTLTAKFDELVLDVQCMLGLAKEVKSVCTLVAELKEVCNTNVSKVQGERRSADKRIVSEKVRAHCVEQTAWILQLKCDLHKFKVWLIISERRNNCNKLSLSAIIYAVACVDMNAQIHNIMCL